MVWSGLRNFVFFHTEPKCCQLDFPAYCCPRFSITETAVTEFFEYIYFLKNQRESQNIPKIRWFKLEKNGQQTQQQIVDFTRNPIDTYLFKIYLI